MSTAAIGIRDGTYPQAYPITHESEEIPPRSEEVYLVSQVNSYSDDPNRVLARINRLRETVFLPDYAASSLVGITLAAGLGLALGTRAIVTAAGAGAGVVAGLRGRVEERIVAGGSVGKSLLVEALAAGIDLQLFALQSGVIAGLVAGAVAGAEGLEELGAIESVAVGFCLEKTISLVADHPQAFGRIVDNLGPRICLGGMAAIAWEIGSEQAGIVLNPLKAITAGSLVGGLAALFFFAKKSVNTTVRS